MVFMKSAAMWHLAEIHWTDYRIGWTPRLMQAPSAVTSAMQTCCVDCVRIHLHLFSIAQRRVCRSSQHHRCPAAASSQMLSPKIYMKIAVAHLLATREYPQYNNRSSESKLTALDYAVSTGATCVKLLKTSIWPMALESSWYRMWSLPSANWTLWVIWAYEKLCRKWRTFSRLNVNFIKKIFELRNFSK